MEKRLCYNPRTRRFEPCVPVTGQANIAKGSGPPPKKPCFEGCQIDAADFSTFQNELIATFGNFLYGGPFIIPDPLGFETIIDNLGLSGTFVGLNLILNGNNTEYFIKSVTNAGLTVPDGPFYFQVELASETGTCRDLTLRFQGTKSTEGADSRLRTTVVSNCLGPFGLVKPGTCTGCPGVGAQKCSTTAPALNIPSVTIPPLDPGITQVDLGGNLTTGGDPCCLYLGATVVGPPLVEATIIDASTIEFNNTSGAPIIDDFSLIIWTACGPVSIELDFIINNTCTGTLSVLGGENVFVANYVDDGQPTLTAPLRKDITYTVSDPCCEPVTAVSLDPNVTVVDAGTYWEITIDPDNFTDGTHDFVLRLVSICNIEDKPMSFNLIDGTCVITPTTILESDLNVAASIPTFLIAAGGSLSFVLTTDMFLNTEPCCADTMTPAPNLTFAPNKLSDIYIQNLVFDGQSGTTVTLVAQPGAVAGAVKNEVMEFIGNCGTFTMEIEYQIV